jgi:hypothetical protein
MKQPPRRHSHEFELLLRNALTHLTAATSQAEAEAIVQRASRAVWQKPIPIVCLVHGKNPNCSCDQPEIKTVPLKLLVGEANDTGTSTADLRVVGKTKA